MADPVVYFFTPLVLLFISEECHDEFFVKFNFFHVACLKMLISKGLGYGIIVGSILVKVPQIVKLVKASSGVGVSLLSLFLELVSITFSMAYSIHNGFPFSSWGEASFMAIQDVILIVLIFYYGQKYVPAMLFAPLYVAVAYVLCSPLTPDAVAVKLQESVLVIGALSKEKGTSQDVDVKNQLFQVWENFSNGHTGQLSFITMVLLTAGSLARIFTSIQETGDVLVATQFGITFVLNAVIMLQMAWYWNVVENKKKVE